MFSCTKRDTFYLLSWTAQIPTWNKKVVEPSAVMSNALKYHSPLSVLDALMVGHTFLPFPFYCLLSVSSNHFSFVSPSLPKPICWHSLTIKLALLSVSCCDSRRIQGPPSKQAIWSITCKGDIFVCEPSPCLEAMPYPTPCDQM